MSKSRSVAQQNNWKQDIEKERPWREQFASWQKQLQCLVIVMLLMPWFTLTAKAEPGLPQFMWTVI